MYGVFTDFCLLYTQHLIVHPALKHQLKVQKQLTVQQVAMASGYIQSHSHSYSYYRGHGGRVVTLSPPTSEAEVRFPARPQVGKLVVACRWSAVYSTVP